MASTTFVRARALPTTPITLPNGTIRHGVAQFAVFIDTHRDKPHVQSFEADIHRGWCKPTPIHYFAPDPDGLGTMMRVESRMNSGPVMPIEIDASHRFVSIEWWEKFLLDSMLEMGRPPFSTDPEFLGMMPTSVLRDPRRKVYHLKSLRQMIVEVEKANGYGYSARHKGHRPIY